jgi:hypothetical protein
MMRIRRRKIHDIPCHLLILYNGLCIIIILAMEIDEELEMLQRELMAVQE